MTFPFTGHNRLTELEFLTSSPLTPQRPLQDWIARIDDEIDDAIEDLTGDDIERLCEFLRKKIDDLIPF